MKLENMQEELITLVRGMRKEGINFKETPPLFRWIYKDEPEILFELLITQPEESEIEFIKKTLMKREL